MKRISWMLFFILFIGSCNEHCDYLESEIKGWHIIDLEVFKVVTPDNYKFIPRKGIDSFVGIISNGEVEIGFDYGCHSWKGIEGKEDALRKDVHQVDPTALMGADMVLRMPEGFNTTKSSNINKLYNEMEEVQLLKNNGSEINSSVFPEGTEYYHKFILRDSVFRIPYSFDEEVLNNELAYIFERDIINHMVGRKLYFDKNKSDTMKIGLYLCDTTNYNQSVNANCSQLGLYARGVPENKFEEVYEIMSSVKLKIRGK